MITVYTADRTGLFSTSLCIRKDDLRETRADEVGDGVEQLEPFWRKMTGEKWANWETFRMTTCKKAKMLQFDQFGPNALTKLMTSRKKNGKTVCAMDNKWKS